MEHFNLSFLRSMLSTEYIENTSKIRDDLERERLNCKFHYERIEFNKLKLWYKDSGGNLRHNTGKFFSIEGIKTSFKENNDIIYQPIINQPEHGVLGLILKEINGVVYCLVQFKIEPGNIGNVQISPSVQATKSNYTKVHNGKSVPYIEYFFEHPSVNIIYSQLQSEQGSKFYCKRNQNIIVQLKPGEDINLQQGYKWITFRQVTELLKFSNIINMDLRSIFSAVTFTEKPVSVNNFYEFIKKSGIAELGNSDFLFSSLNEDYAVHTLFEIRQWLQNKRDSHSLKTELVNLNNIFESNNWLENEVGIYSPLNPNFEVNYLEVFARDREVSTWSQPIVSDNNPKINGFLIKKINGVLHFLAKCCEEPGLFKGPEIGPTVHNSSSDDDLFISYFLQNNREGTVLYDQMLSEEGGRFFQTENRYMLVLTTEDVEIDNNDYMWMTLYQLKRLLEEECNINVEARTIISCVDFGESI
ncbi:NDP-hexose 2,3-dehydratase family protein [Paenibacillus hodogayensis]|uniref:NDP-hexose 2,3-dehydratase family protein n=1 Tax=Paenibacillus hodogayensis TaxID=279208 RepID=A0ABV5VRZ7_9BACL